jgi:hypothetical protein
MVSYRPRLDRRGGEFRFLDLIILRRIVLDFNYINKFQIMIIIFPRNTFANRMRNWLWVLFNLIKVVVVIGVVVLNVLVGNT